MFYPSMATRALAIFEPILMYRDALVCKTAKNIHPSDDTADADTDRRIAILKPQMQEQYVCVRYTSLGSQCD